MWGRDQGEESGAVWEGELGRLGETAEPQPFSLQKTLVKHEPCFGTVNIKMLQVKIQTSGGLPFPLNFDRPGESPP